MAFDEIEKILALMREHDLAEFELEREGLKLRVRKAQSYPVMPAMMPIAATPAAHSPHLAAAMPPQAAASGADVAEDELELAVVKSPIVGTFYRSAEPEAPPFVDIGTMVKKGQVLCIIEAMKLMNEIESDVDGIVMKIFPQNGQPIEYGEKLFAIKV